MYFTVLLFSVNAYSQSFPMQHYTLDDGLPSNTVYSVYKDSKGYLWFGTKNGIARYNGIKFEKFTTEDGLADNEIFFFKEDTYGRLWMATYNGKLCYYKDGIFYTEKNDPLLRMPFVAPFILYLNVEKDGSLLMFFNDRQKFIDIAGDQYHTYYLDNIKDLPIPKFLTEIQKLSNKQYALIYKSERIVIDTNYNIVSRNKYADSEVFGPRDVDRISNYLYTSTGLYSKDQGLLFSFSKGLVENAVLSAYSNGTDYFIGTGSGLYINNDLRCLKGENITSIVQDNERNYWVSTLKNGVFYFDKNFRQEQVYKAQRNQPVRFSAAIDSYVFFTTAGNNFYRIHDEKVSQIFHYAKDTVQQTYVSTAAFDIGPDHVYHSMYGDDAVLISDIFKEHPQVEVFPNIHEAAVKKMLAADSHLYLLNPTFISMIDPRNQKLSSEQHVDDFKVSGSVHAMTRAADNTIWYSTFNNVYKIVAGTPVLQPQFKNTSFKWFCMCGDYLVGCTEENKLIVCNHPNGNMTRTEIAGQNCVWDHADYIDDRHIIVSTNELYRIITLEPSADVPKYTITIVEHPIVPMNAESICSNGRDCYFFKNGEIFSFPLNDLIVKPSRPSIFFNTLKTEKATYNSEAGDITIPYRESRNIRISFSILSYSSKHTMVEYSVSKGDKDKWLPIKAEEINLVNPRYGKYRIKLRVRTLESNPSEVAVLEFTILNPFWATWWFIALCAVLIATSVTVSVLWAIRRSLRKKDRAHTVKIGLLRSEYKAMNALMNPHFIFNVLNNVQGLINDDDKSAANEYLKTFSLLVRQNMNNISRELIPLYKELQLLENYLKLEKMRFKEYLNYKIKVEDGVDVNDIMIPPLLIQPLVENSILHGLLPAQSADGLININIFERDEWLTIEIRDNGIGINTAQANSDRLHESFGLDNVRKRISQLAEIHSTEITFDVAEIKGADGVVKGTVATIKMAL